MNRNIWVYDIETIASVFTYVAINIDTEEIVKFVIHPELDQSVDLYNHLVKCRALIGFNNLDFDYPIIHYFIYEVFNKNLPVRKIVSLLYAKAQFIINVQDKNKKFKIFTNIKESEILIPQIDLFKIWHYNNAARSTSLKALQISMNYPNVLDMPISHTDLNVTLDQIPEILEYNLNDVLSTFEFYKKSIGKLSLRKSLTDVFKIKCRNWSDSKIGEQLIAKLYCERNNCTYWDIKNLRTNRESIALKDCILDYISFESVEFNKLLSTFKSKIITETKGSIKESVIYKSFKYDYGTGGIHGCIKSGVYEADDNYVIIDADVGSLYPRLAITNNFFIEHLGMSFINVYKSIVDMRLDAKSRGDMILSDGFKLAANSVYGKSNDKDSFLYDPKFTMQITLNGQLLLSLLCEQLNNIPDLTMLQVNTDGITVRINKLYIEQYYEICKNWEKLTKLNLEYVEYSKMIIGDVNNYLAITTKGKIKNKGRFEVDKVVGSETAYHKDNSFRIIPLAIQEYFVNNTPIEDTINNHTDIYDFCGRQKFKGKDWGETHDLINGIKVVNKQQKNVRYYISNKGNTFIKRYDKDKSSEVINAGYQVIIFNKFIEKQNYDINYGYYIKEARKEIKNIIKEQLCLF